MAKPGLKPRSFCCPGKYSTIRPHKLTVLCGQVTVLSCWQWCTTCTTSQRPPATSGFSLL